MKLFVTGATGFVGSAVVDAAIERGHEVIGLVRRPPSGHREGVEFCQGNIINPEAYRDALSRCDAVIHLAAVKGGDLQTQFKGTVVGTESLLSAMKDVGLARLVHISTFSVYDYAGLSSGALLDEGGPIEDEPKDRDEYAQTKLIQEDLVWRFAETGGRVTVIRPGAVWGRDNWWNGGAIVSLGGIGLAVSPKAPLKLTYVENCADAIVVAAETEDSVGRTLNVVDTEQPTLMEFASILRDAGVELPRLVPVPYGAAASVARLAEVVNQTAFDGRAKLPGVLIPARLAAQIKPLRYSNDEARRVLKWNPRYSTAEAARRSVAR